MNDPPNAFWFFRHEFSRVNLRLWRFTLQQNCGVSTPAAQKTLASHWRPQNIGAGRGTACFTARRP